MLPMAVGTEPKLLVSSLCRKKPALHHFNRARRKVSAVRPCEAPSRICCVSVRFIDLNQGSLRPVFCAAEESPPESGIQRLGIKGVARRVVSSSERKHEHVSARADHGSHLDRS